LNAWLSIFFSAKYISKSGSILKLQAALKPYVFYAQERESLCLLDFPDNR
jgi:hypothetical protein